MELKEFNEEEFKTLLLESVLAAGGAAGILTGNIANTAGAMMAAAAASPVLYGAILAGRQAKHRWIS